MCGIAGLLTTAAYERDELIARAGRMSAPLVHRGPDDCGVWGDERSGVALGFRRLAIVDLSPQGHQPMSSASGRFVAVFNGEIYNFRELRRELGKTGAAFRGQSDTEVVLSAFERWGIDASVRRFVGMFAIAVWDTQYRRLTLIRDRLGKKPLYVYREPGLVTFGSELKALAAGPSFDRTVDREGLAQFLRYLYVPAPRSIFRHARKLPAGHVLTIVDPAAPLPESRPYWSLREVAREGLAHPIHDEAEAIDELDAQLKEAVACRLHADVPLGALLSGGIDSSIVVAMMQEACARPVRTYTIGFADHEFDEAPHAARVAERLGTDHTELMLSGEDAHALIPRLAETFDEPLADPSQLPTLLVSQLARRHVTVALCGDGGDELFGGYNRYVYGTRMLPRVSRLPFGLRRYVGNGIGGVRAATWDRLAGVTGALTSLPAARIGERAHKLAHVMSARSVSGMYRSLLSAWQEPAALLDSGDAAGPADANDFILDGPEPSHLLDRMMLADQLAYLPDDLLAKVDRASMAVSLEVRAPLLDHRVAEFSWRVPAHMKLRGTTGKWILRQVLYRRVPASIVERPKMGFSVPIDRWLRGPLRAWAADLLTASRRADGGLLDHAPIARAWEDLQEGRRQTGAALWAVIVFQAWADRWLSGSRT